MTTTFTSSSMSYAAKLLAASVVTLFATSVDANATDVYQPAPVNIANATEIPNGLARLLKRLASAADKQDIRAVRSFVGKSFFWDGDHGGGYDASKSSKDNFTTALSLDPETIKAEYLPEKWTALKSLLVSPNASRYKRGSSTLCLPGKGQLLNEAAAEKTTEKFGIDPWYGMFFSVGSPVPVRSSADSATKIVGTISNEAVIVRHELRTDPDASWEPVHLPDGAKGWARKELVRSFLDPQLCFAEGSNLTWEIVGYNGGGD